MPCSWDLATKCGPFCLARLELNKTRQDKDLVRLEREGEAMDLGESTSRPSHPIPSARGIPSSRHGRERDMPTVKVAERNERSTSSASALVSGMSQEYHVSL